MELKKIYSQLISSLNNQKTNILDNNFPSDDYKGRIKYIVDNWGKPAPELPYFLKGDVTIDNSKVIYEFVKLLNEGGLLLRNNIFSKLDIKDPLYLISINRNDGKKLNLYCNHLSVKDNMLINLDNLRFKLSNK